MIVETANSADSHGALGEIHHQADPDQTGQ
jgi:hypothetical protein